MFYPDSAFPNRKAKFGVRKMREEELEAFIDSLYKYYTMREVNVTTSDIKRELGKMFCPSIVS